MLCFRPFLILLLYFSIFSVCKAQSPPQILATGNQLFCGDAPMPIVTDVTISDGTGSLDVVYIQIAAGYTFGSDVLFLDATLPNITASWVIGEGQLRSL